MKQERRFPSVRITKKGEKAARGGHPWVYAAELLDAVPAELPNGGLLDVLTENGRYLGTGFYSAKSKIAVRILSDNANERFEEDFWRRRIHYAVASRKTVMPGADFVCCRLVFGEADGIPGFTADRFGDILVTQVLSYGTEQIKGILYGALLQEVPEIRGIYERNDASIRELEGLPVGKGWAEGFPHPDETVTEITENGIRYRVDFENGQKTGFFLDQKYNRLAVSRISAGMRVLDCFTHTGSFALNALRGGASSVTAVDISESALAVARGNAVLNGVSDRIEFLAADVFDLLPKLSEEKKTPYDFIILDPPAFTKSSKTLDAAKRGYKEINYRAMRLLPRGGYLATCSCSHFMKTELFLEMLKSAASDAGVRLKILEQRQQAPDHPILLNVPETDYLKFVIAQAV